MSDAWDGRPQNPERRGYHWLVPGAGRQYAWPVLWHETDEGEWVWSFRDADDEKAARYYEHIADGSWTYGGPLGSLPDHARLTARVAELEAALRAIANSDPWSGRAPLAEIARRTLTPEAR